MNKLLLLMVREESETTYEPQETLTDDFEMGMAEERG